MLILRDRPGRGSSGLSRRGSKGGTIGDYASKLSQLIRYCYFKKINFIELNDDSFSEFIHILRSERADYNPSVKRKTEATISTTGRICLDFLNYVGNFYGDSYFVAIDGTIRAEIKNASSTSSKNNKIINWSSWQHHSLSTSGRQSTRNPIPASNIDRLHHAAHSIKSSRFIEMRRVMQLRLLEQSGARRGEIALLKVSDILKAANMDEPMIKFTTLKKGDYEERLIPVFRMLINDLLKYIRVYRNPVIRKTIGIANDHDFFFIGEKGTPLNADTLTSETYKLRKHAGIEEQACNHMFRHSFCTNLFTLLIERHHFENEDKFRQQLLGNETFKAEVMQWTGHSSPASLDVYINYAFAQVSNYSKTVSSVDLVRAQQFFDKKQSELIVSMEQGEITVSQYKAEINKLKKARDSDFSIANKNIHKKS